MKIKRIVMRNIFSSISAKIIFGSAVLAAIFLGFTLFIVAQNAETVINERFFELLEKKTEITGNDLKILLRDIESDLNTISSTPPTQGIFRSIDNNGFDDLENSTYEDWKRRLETIMIGLAESKQRYHQLRLLDTGGRELVRVNYNKDYGAVRVPADDLQNKSDRPYVRNTNTKSPGQTYVSNIELNREGTPPQISEPLTPVIRYGKPIFDSNGKRRGMIILNVDVFTILSELEKYFRTSGDEDAITIADKNGYYIKHANPNKLWGGPSDFDTGESLFNDIPEISKLNLPLNTHITIEDSDVIQSLIHIPIIEKRAEEGGLVVLISATKDSLLSITNGFSRRIILVGITAFLLLLLVFQLFVKKLLYPLEQLTTAARQIGEGDLGEAVVPKITSSKEMSILSDALRIMTVKLNKLYNSLESEVKNKTNELQSKVKELEKTKQAILNILEDTKQEKDQIAALSRELNKFRLATDYASDHIVITDPDGIILYANAAVEKITGFSQREVLGRKAGAPELWGGNMSEEFYRSFWHIIKHQKKPFSGELKNNRKNGEEYVALATVSPVVDSEGEIEFFVGIERDITNQKKSEERLRLLSQRFSLAVQAANIGVWEWNIQTNKLIWDDQMYDLYGVKREEFSGAYEAWENGLHPEDRERAARELRFATEGRSEFNTTFRIVTPAGQTRYLRANAAVIRNAKGEAERMVGINIDITHQVEVDQAKTEFVSLASHQLRTPLSSVNWYAEMLMDGDAGDLSPKQKKYLDEIITGNNRMIGLVNALLDVSRLELGTFMIDPEMTDISTLALSVRDEMEHQIEAKELNVTIESKLTQENKQLMADPKLLRIILQNLLSNAVKYTKKGGDITMSIDFASTGESFGGKELTRNYYTCSVRDNGYGIPESQQASIFEKLFRADNIRSLDVEGTGLGLYIIKAILAASGGSIWFESTEGKGSTFYFVLPEKGMQARKGEKRLSSKK